VEALNLDLPMVTPKGDRDVILIEAPWEVEVAKGTLPKPKSANIVRNLAMSFLNVGHCIQRRDLKRRRLFSHNPNIDNRPSVGLEFDSQVRWLQNRGLILCCNLS
jgi:hypothetical protein